MPIDPSCCTKEKVLMEPCQAITDGDLTFENHQSYGFTPWSLAMLNAICVGGGEGIILGEIRDNQQNPALFGTHVVTTGDNTTPIGAGTYSSWVIVRTGGTGALTVDGLPLLNTGDSTSEEAQPQFKVPAPTVVIAVDATYAWRAKS